MSSFDSNVAAAEIARATAPVLNVEPVPMAAKAKESPRPKRRPSSPIEKASYKRVKVIDLTTDEYDTDDSEPVMLSGAAPIASGAKRD